MARVTFAVRLLIYVLAPWGYLFLSPIEVALLIVLAISLTWLADFALGNTIWAPANLATLLFYLSYLVAVAIAFVSYNRPLTGLLISLVFLLIALGSDAIGNSHRWKLLLPAAFICLLEFALYLMDTPFRLEAATYPAVSCLAILARYLFPRTKHLIHTSLDYRLARVEILSLGMKRVAAVGLRRKSTSHL